MFGDKKKQNDVPQVQESGPSIDPRQVFKDTVLAIAHPWDVPSDIRALHPAYTGIDAATSDLSVKEIQSKVLKMSALNDFLLATMFRASEIDEKGVQIISRNMQAEDLAYIRLMKSKNGRLMQLAVTVHQIHEHRYSGDDNGGMRRVL